jgi:hypothetical protein
MLTKALDVGFNFPHTSNYHKTNNKLGQKTMNTPITTFWQNISNNMCAGNNNVQSLCQAQSMYGQTVASIMAARGMAVQQWWQNMPSHMAALTTCKTPAEALECMMKWHVQTTTSAVNLMCTTQAERMHLLQSCQTVLARSNLQPAAVNPASQPRQADTAKAMPEVQPAPQPAQARKPTVGYGALNQGPATVNSNMPSYLTGTFIAGQRQPAKAVQVQLKLVENTTSAPESSPQVSSTANSFSRSSTSAAQVISATARRSVLARNASRPRRAGGSR